MVKFSPCLPFQSGTMLVDLRLGLSVVGAGDVESLLTVWIRPQWIPMEAVSIAREGRSFPVDI